MSKFSYKLEESDYKIACKRIWKHTTSKPHRIFRESIATILYIPAGIATVIIFKNLNGFLPYVVLFAMVCLILEPIIIKYIDSRKVSESTKNMSKNYIVILNDESFQLDNGRNISIIEYKNIIEATQDTEYFYVYVEKIMAFIFPLSELSENEVFQEFVERIKTLKLSSEAQQK